MPIRNSSNSLYFYAFALVAIVSNSGAQNRDADLDPSFGAGIGAVTYGVIGSSLDITRHISRDSSGAYLVSSSFGLAGPRYDRFLADGTRDTSLNYSLPTGLISDEPVLIEPIRSILPNTGDSSFFVAYRMQAGADSDLIVCRKTNTGAPETTFANAGCGTYRSQNTPVFVEFFQQRKALNVAYRQGFGTFGQRILIGLDKAKQCGLGCSYVAQILSINSNTGVIDSSFGSSGTKMIGAAQINSTLLDMKYVQGTSATNSFIYALSRVDSANSSDVVVSKLTAFNGAAVAAFCPAGCNGIAGEAGTRLLTTPATPYSAALAADADGIVFVSVSYEANALVTVYKLLPDGSLDASFGSNGTANLPTYPPPVGLKIAGMGVTSTGKILIGGHTYGTTALTRTIAIRLRPNGTPDRHFDAGNFFRAYTNVNGTDSQVIYTSVFDNDQLTLGGYTGIGDAFLIRLQKNQDIFDDGLE